MVENVANDTCVVLAEVVPADILAQHLLIDFFPHAIGDVFDDGRGEDALCSLGEQDDE